MTIRISSPIQFAALLAVTLTWLAASVSCTEKASVALARVNVCERRILTPTDVSGILRGPVTGSSVPSNDSQTCAFTTGGRSRFEVSVRPGRGRAIVDSWIGGKMALEAVPLRGVGDHAAWQHDLHEVIAEKNDVLCDISVIGTEGDFVDTSEFVLEDRIGNLCNKVLDAVP